MASKFGNIKKKPYWFSSTLADSQFNAIYSYFPMGSIFFAFIGSPILYFQMKEYVPHGEHIFPLKVAPF